MIIQKKCKLEEQKSVSNNADLTFEDYKKRFQNNEIILRSKQSA